MEKGLHNLRVVSFESRRAADMARLIEKRGGVPIQAPSMREVPLQNQREAFDFADVLLGQGVDAMILLTGVGSRMLVEAMCLKHPRDDVFNALKACDLLCRGPKPVTYLKEAGLQPTLVAPEPNTWRELITEFDQRGYPLAQRNIAIQEYGRSNPDLVAALQERHAIVRSVPVYGWQLPEDTTELEEALHRIARGEADIALFTSAQQVDHIFALARRLDCFEQLLTQLQTATLVASIGPITTEALIGHHVPPNVEPKRPKMGHLIATLSAEAKTLLGMR
ncbi:MAG: uroporphyrinogen-III synthase [Myxococcota bacterium]|nr:uroporphyrinogen-III synthase [Myxococcota bacterium]